MIQKKVMLMLPTIRQGSTGDLVSAAQYLTGYAQLGQASGKYDAAFVAWVCAWQRQRDLSPDGIIGPKTWTAIAAAAPSCSTSKNRISAASCAVQLLIGDLDADGIYGPKTKSAVAAFQTASRLDPDGICGPKTWNALIVDAGAVPDAGKVLNKCVHYLQWDGRWKNVKYSTHTSDQTIGNSGCGPTAMAMILATWIDPAITPVEVCDFSIQRGCRTWDSGTAWSLYPLVFEKYPQFRKYVATDSVAVLKAALAEGALAVCSMNSNDNHFWTTGGHFITAIGYDAAGYIYANDPNKSSAPRRQHQDKFRLCMKQAFIFWPSAETSEDDDAGKAIIDISKHNGAIDFDTLASQVSLVIARASIGSDMDERIAEYAEAMNRRNIPFGVYCYTYAKDEAKAIDEARKMVQYASPYKPRFYVLDVEQDINTHDAIVAFAQECRRLGVQRLGCYVAHHRYREYDFESVKDLFDFVWIPRYGKNDGTIAAAVMPAYPCDLWQYTSEGTIPGIKTEVDLNVITGQGVTLGWLKGGE